MGRKRGKGSGGQNKGQGTDKEPEKQPEQSSGVKGDGDKQAGVSQPRKQPLPVQHGEASEEFQLPQQPRQRQWQQSLPDPQPPKAGRGYGLPQQPRQKQWQQSLPDPQPPKAGRGYGLPQQPRQRQWQQSLPDPQQPEPGRGYGLPQQSRQKQWQQSLPDPQQPEPERGYGLPQQTRQKQWQQSLPDPQQPEPERGYGLPQQPRQKHWQQSLPDPQQPEPGRGYGLPQQPRQKQWQQSLPDPQQPMRHTAVRGRGRGRGRSQYKEQRSREEYGPGTLQQPPQTFQAEGQSQPAEVSPPPLETRPSQIGWHSKETPVVVESQHRMDKPTSFSGVPPEMGRPRGLVGMPPGRDSSGFLTGPTGPKRLPSFRMSTPKDPIGHPPDLSSPSLSLQGSRPLAADLKAQEETPPLQSFVVQASLPVSTEAVQLPPVQSDVEEITKGIKTLKIPERKGCGTNGRKTVVETNYLKLDLSKLRNRIAFHYDVELEPPTPRRLLRRAIEEFGKQHFPGHHPAFDGRKNMFSSRKLPEIKDVVIVSDGESNKEREFKVTIKYASQVNLESLATYMNAGSSMDPPQKAIQVLDVVLRNAPANSGFVQVGRCFFTPPRDQVLQLGNGLEMWYGFFQSAILGWKPLVNIDVAHKGFPTSQNVVDAILEVLNIPRESLSGELNAWQKENFMSYIRGLKIEYTIPGNPSSKRVYKVNNIAQCASKLWFDFNGRQITIEEYFARVKGYSLRYPHIPCLHVGSVTRTNPIYLPSELCTIVRGQVTIRKMNETQTSSMIRCAATNTDVRKSKIYDALRSVKFNESSSVKEFGLSVGGQFEKIEARVLDAPKLEYSNSRLIQPRNGVWKACNFVDGKGIDSWIILNLNGNYTREDNLRHFAEEMWRTGKTLGMNIGHPSAIRSMSKPTTHNTRELDSFFSSLENVSLVFVVVPDRGDTYAKVKQLAEQKYAVLTQCIKAKTIQRINPITCSNILLKVNSKLNGVNHTISEMSRPVYLTRPAMMVGADVTHPSPDQRDIPSVAAVCASHDPVGLFKFNIQIRLQPPKAEIIEDLEAIMREHLLFFYRKNNCKPERIIFFRDGVSEGQFEKVLYHEVNAIRRACSSMPGEYKPLVTFLVVQKRHHTRFFPTKKEDQDGKNRNVPPGTIVDTEITHPVELDFYLVSHASIQGVSRPTKYHVLWNDDEDMTTDDLEKLTYYLCHMFSRCTRSVSYPAPTYNAHLAAYRARVYLEGRRVVLSNLQSEQKRYFETDALKSIIKECPMYFV